MSNFRKLFVVLLTTLLLGAAVVALTACTKETKTHHFAIEKAETLDKNGNMWNHYVIVERTGKKIDKIYFSKFANLGVLKSANEVQDVYSQKNKYGNTIGDQQNPKKEWFEYADMFTNYYIENFKGEVLKAPDSFAGMSENFFKKQKDIFFGLVEKALKAPAIEKGEFKTEGFVYVDQNNGVTPQDYTASGNVFAQFIIVNGRLVYANYDAYYFTNKHTADANVYGWSTKNFVKEKYGMTNASPIEKDWFEQTAYLAEEALAKQGLGTKDELKTGATVKEVTKFIELTNKVKNEKVTLYTIENSKTLENDLTKLSKKLLDDLSAKFVEGFKLEVTELNDEAVKSAIGALVRSLTKHFPVTFEATALAENKTTITFTLFTEQLVKTDVVVVKK